MENKIGQIAKDSETVKTVAVIAKEQSKKLTRHIQRVKMLDFTFQKILNVSISTAGSRGDGSNNEKSDTDLIFVVQKLRVVETKDRSLRQSMSGSAEILYYETNACHPGYCNLIFALADDERDSNNVFLRLCAGENRNVSSAKFLQFAMTIVPKLFKQFGGRLQNIQNIHGPCITPKHLFGIDQSPIDLDCVFSVECDSWPAVAREWLDRKRINGWPNKSLLEDVARTRCSFVPIGFSQDESQRNLEWRISFTMAEKHLAWSFNGTQLLCLDGLKLLHTDKLEPGYPKLLCSYFLKTLMFWLIEETQQGIWKAENFFVCFKICLKKLIDSMESATCPHFFIPENNMFDKKDKSELRDAAYFIKSLEWDRLIFQCIDKKNKFFKRNVLFRNHIYISTLSLCRHLVHGQLTAIAENSISDTLMHYCQMYKTLDVDPSLVKQLEFSLLSTIGSAILSEVQTIQLTENEPKVKKALQLLGEGRRSDGMAGDLKFATALLFLGKIDEALCVLHQLEVLHLEKIVHYSFYSRLFINEPDDDTHPTDDSLSLLKVMGKFIALDLIFLPCEICSVPNFVKYELSDELTLFMSPIVYMYCLEFECYRTRTDVTSMQRAYEKFCKARELFTKGGVSHIDWDLKAYFAVTLGNYDLAYSFLKQTNISKSPRTASLWILSVLVWKSLKNNS